MTGHSTVCTHTMAPTALHAPSHQGIMVASLGKLFADMSYSLCTLSEARYAGVRYRAGRLAFYGVWEVWEVWEVDEA